LYHFPSTLNERICLQGSGKSHTTSVLLESVLIRDERLGTLPKPLSAIVYVHITLPALLIETMY
jgi:hypothetical protein